MVIIKLCFLAASFLDPCGFNSIATENPQPFTSPGYPDDYPNFAYCAWEFEAPPGFLIQLNFINFHTDERGDNVKV